MVKSQIQGAITWGTRTQTGCVQGSRRSKAGLPLASQKGFIDQQVFLANGRAAPLLPFHHVKCWVCRVFWAVLGDQGLPTMHVVLIALCGLGDNMWPQLPLAKMIESLVLRLQPGCPRWALLTLMKNSPKPGETWRLLVAFAVASPTNGENTPVLWYVDLLSFTLMFLYSKRKSWVTLLKVCPWEPSWVLLTKLCSPGCHLHNRLSVLLDPRPHQYA